MSGPHHDCLVRTAHLELELFGDIVSTSVKDHVESWLRAFDARACAQYQQQPKKPPQPRLPDPGQPEWKR